MTIPRPSRRGCKRVLIGWTAWLALAFAPAACADGGAEAPKAASEYAYQNVLFSGVTQIPAPHMTSGHSQPAVSWPATDQAHVVCAIFSERIGVKERSITNPDKIVWIWHTGLGQGREGNVLYEHGLSAPSAHGKPAPLPPGTYYWAVWALNEEGLPSHASEEYVHTVK